MCGPSAAQTTSDQELQQLQATSLQEAQTTFGEDQGILAQLTPIYSAIAAKGPNQKGFSDEELENLNSQAVEGTAENYQQGARAVNEQLAGEGGGANPLPSGAQDEMKQQVANSAAQNESNEETGILGSDYAQGYNEFTNASNGLLAVGSQENPLGFEGGATSAGNAAANEANTLEQQSTSWLTPILGAVGSIGGGWAQGGFKTP